VTVLNPKPGLRLERASAAQLHRPEDDASAALKIQPSPVVDDATFCGASRWTHGKSPRRKSCQAFLADSTPSQSEAGEADRRLMPVPPTSTTDRQVGHLLQSSRKYLARQRRLCVPRVDSRFACGKQSPSTKLGANCLTAVAVPMTTPRQLLPRDPGCQSPTMEKDPQVFRSSAWWVRQCHDHPSNVDAEPVYQMAAFFFLPWALRPATRFAKRSFSINAPITR